MDQIAPTRTKTFRAGLISAPLVIALMPIAIVTAITERTFSGWTMGQVNVDLVNPGLLLKYSLRPKLDPFAGSGRTPLAYLMELVATGAISA